MAKLFLELLVELFVEEGGATAIEYGLIVALASLGGLAALHSLGGSLTGIFAGAAADLDGAAATAQVAASEPDCRHLAASTLAPNCHLATVR